MPALTVPTIFTAVDKLSSVVSKMQGNVGKFASESQKRYAQMSRSAQNWSTNARQVALSAGIMGAAIIAPLALSVKKAMEFEDQMANIGTLVDTTKEDMKAMGNGVLDVFKRVPVPMEQLTEALYKIRSAGIPAAQAMDVLSKSAVLGIAGRGTAIQAADALTSAMNVFRDEGLSTNKIASMLFETVKVGKTTIEGMSESFGATANVVHAGGVSLKDFLSATAAMTVMGEPATQAMNQIRASVFGLEKPTTRMAFLFHSLGVKNVHELISKFGNLGNAMTAVEDRGKKLGVNMAKAWGKVGAYAAVISLTGNSKGAYNNNLASMAKSEADLAAGYAEKLQTMKAQAQLLSNEIQYFSIKVGTILLPILVKLAKFIQPVIEGIANWGRHHTFLAKSLIIITGAIGILLLTIAPIALIISGIADAIKIWAGLNLWLGASAATAAAEIATETVAITGFGTALEGVTGAAAAANLGMKGLIGTIATFAVPAGLAALAGFGIVSSFQADAARKAQKTVANLDPNSKEGKAYAQWSANWRPGPGQSWSDEDPAQFLAYWAAKQGGVHPGIMKGDSGYVTPGGPRQMPALLPNKDSLTHHQLEIILKHPDGTVDSVKHTINGKPSASIPHSLKQGSTTANR